MAGGLQIGEIEVARPRPCRGRRRSRFRRPPSANLRPSMSSWCSVMSPPRSPLSIDLGRAAFPCATAISAPRENRSRRDWNCARSPRRNRSAHRSPCIAARRASACWPAASCQTGLSRSPLRVLLKDADRFALRLADQRRIGVAAAEIGEAADRREHLAKFIGPLPRDGEGADARRCSPRRSRASPGRAKADSCFSTSGKISSSRKRA